ncbi:MAG: component of SufBCD complex [Celeribacter sp.]|jgi:hypothetical protein
MLDWYSQVLELIDLRSFSNLWYWIGLAVVWSQASHRVLGVPYDLVTRAQRDGGQAETDLNDIVRVYVTRLLYIQDTAGLWIFAIFHFVLTSLLILGFWYGVEFAQALSLIVVPMAIVGGLSVRTARAIHRTDGADLHRRLRRHRLVVQLIGMVAIFITAFWGMLQNMTFGVI